VITLALATKETQQRVILFHVYLPFIWCVCTTQDGWILTALWQNAVPCFWFWVVWDSETAVSFSFWCQ